MPLFVVHDPSIEDGVIGVYRAENEEAIIEYLQEEEDYGKCENLVFTEESIITIKKKK